MFLNGHAVTQHVKGSIPYHPRVTRMRQNGSYIRHLLGHTKFTLTKLRLCLSLLISSFFCLKRSEVGSSNVSEIKCASLDQKPFGRKRFCASHYSLKISLEMRDRYFLGLTCYIPVYRCVYMLLEHIISN